MCTHMVCTRLYLVYTGMYPYKQSIAKSYLNQHTFFSLVTPDSNVVWRDKYAHIFKHWIITLKCDKTQRQWDHLYRVILGIARSIPRYTRYSSVYTSMKSLYWYIRSYTNIAELYWVILSYTCVRIPDEPWQLEASNYTPDSDLRVPAWILW